MAEVEPENQIKVKYVSLMDQDSVAYVDQNDLIGEDKYTGEKVKLVWNSGLQRYEEINEK